MTTNKCAEWIKEEKVKLKITKVSREDAKWTQKKLRYEDENKKKRLNVEEDYK